MGKKPIILVTYEDERISIKKRKKQLTLHKMCVTSLLGGLWTNLWPFYGLDCLTVFSVYKGLPFLVNLYIERKPFAAQPTKRS